MLSLKVKHFAKIRADFLSKSQLVVILNSISNRSSSSSSTYGGTNGSSATIWLPSRTASTSRVFNGQSSNDAIAASFKEWFKSRNDALLDKIFKILGGTQKDDNDMSYRCSTDLALSELGLRLNERFVLDVLSYGRKDVLSCLKFFDWAGRQSGFYHTRITFNAIFKILSQAKLMSLMLDFLESYIKPTGFYRVRFHSTLVMGYAVAGKPNFALHLFGKMRFQGLDLDSFGFHVLLNALVEEGCFDAVRVISKQIQMRGFESEITCAIIMKSFCKQKLLDEAEAYLREKRSEGRTLNGHVLSVLVDALCKNDKFDRAGKLIDEFQGYGNIPMNRAYNVWLMDLVRAGKLDEALDFMKKRKSLDGYIPDVFRYNTLICRLLRENRLEEVFELLMEMKESQITPDEVTMNAALCFFCKAGMVDAALDLYNSGSEFGLSLNSLAYNFLINTLCGDRSIDEAFSVLQGSVAQGYFPGRKAFYILADAFCREGKLDKMKELLLFALERNVVPSALTCDKFISALCKANRVEDGYLLYGELAKINEGTARSTFINLINGLNKSNRGDTAAKLLIEMQTMGHQPGRRLFRDVILSLCGMENPEKEVLKLLNMQLSCHGFNSQIYNFFIYGASYVKKPELARVVYEMMLRSGIEPNLNSDILMLNCYLKNGRISDAFKLFNSLHERRKIGRRAYSTMVTGLCSADKLDIALEIFKEMKEKKINPTIECYELLIKSLCENGRYDTVVTLVNEYEKTGRVFTSFMGNTLLLYSLQSQELYEAWMRLQEDQSEKSDKSTKLGLLIGAFCGRVRVNEHFDILEEIENCFPVNVFTCNLLLRCINLVNMDRACEFFNRMCQKGHQPNQWTYYILARGYFNRGRTEEANRWLEEMLRKGFSTFPSTTKLI